MTDPSTRLGIAEFRYLSAAVDCAVLIWAGDVGLPIPEALPLIGYGLPRNGREIGATFTTMRSPLIVIEGMEAS